MALYHLTDHINVWSYCSLFGTKIREKGGQTWSICENDHYFLIQTTFITPTGDCGSMDSDQPTEGHG